MAVSVRSVDLDIEREPLVQPFGFKGGSFREKWLCRATLKSASEREATGIGGLAVLWSDDGVCASHTEVGGNLLMAAMLEFGLQAAAGKTFSSPAALLGELSESVFEYGRTITARPNLRKTFAYNALVALDNAAWLLQAREQGVQSFDQMIPSACRAVLGHRHERLIVVPAVSYSTGMDEIHRLVEEGHGILKVKLGAPGYRSEMLRKDRQRLAAIHAAVGALDSPLGDGERHPLEEGTERTRASIQTRHPLLQNPACGLPASVFGSRFL